MPESARIIPFPRRGPVRSLASQDIAAAAKCYLASPQEERQDAFDEVTRHPDVLLNLIAILKDLKDEAPHRAVDEAEALYQLVERAEPRCGVFDEHDYLLGELALVVATACRYLSRKADSARWLDRAEAAFRHTINSAPHLANVSLNRLALAHEMGRFEEVLELLPSLVQSYSRLGMGLERARCNFMQALALKQTGRQDESFEILEGLRKDDDVRQHAKFFGQILVHVGDFHVVEGRLDLALQVHREALSVLRNSNYQLGLAELKWSIGDIYRGQGNLGMAAESFREAQADYRALEMQPKAVQLHLAIAETLLAMDRPREAEWEILAALPTIEEQKMVPEGFAAVALLKESVRRRKTDTNALRALREHLQANK